MSRQFVLRTLVVGFSLVVLLVIAAATIGYQASISIQQNAQALVREHLVMSDRATILETRIEEESGILLRDVVWVLGACCALALAFSALTIGITNKAFRRIEWQAKELGRVSWNMLQGQEVVARRFSHEMHDELGQSLTGLKGMLKRLDPAEFERRRAECVQILDEVLTSVRELSQLLRPVILDDFGLDAGLRWQATRFTQRTGIEVDYSSNFNGRLSENLETHLFRIAQEALTNVARHSGATRASIRFRVERGRVHLVIEDNGRGLAKDGPVKSTSLGMVGMRARAREVEGELHIQSGDSGGLQLRVEAPLRKDQDAAEQQDSYSVG